MNSTHGGAKARVLRKHILQLARELYLHPHSGVAMAENLKTHAHDMNPAALSAHFIYLADQGLLQLHKNNRGLCVQITPKGIDALEGALRVRGVEDSDAHFARLPYKKEIRRGILRYCQHFPESHNEDAEIHADLKASGFGNLLIEEVRFHMWYLREKKYLDLKTPHIGGDIVFMARISAAGTDLLENNLKDHGVSSDETEKD